MPDANQPTGAANDKSPWDDLDIAADTEFEQASAATEHLATLARLFYATLITGEGAMPAVLAAPVVAVYVKAVMDRGGSAPNERSGPQ